MISYFYVLGKRENIYHSLGDFEVLVKTSSMQGLILILYKKQKLGGNFSRSFWILEPEPKEFPLETLGPHRFVLHNGILRSWPVYPGKYHYHSFNLSVLFILKLSDPFYSEPKQEIAQLIPFVCLHMHWIGRTRSCDEWQVYKSDYLDRNQNKTEQKKVKTVCGAASLPYFSDVIKTKDRSSLLS